MHNWTYCSFSSMRRNPTLDLLWSAASFQYGEASALDFDDGADDEHYLLDTTVEPTTKPAVVSPGRLPPLDLRPPSVPPRQLPELMQFGSDFDKHVVTAEQTAPDEVNLPSDHTVSDLGPSLSKTFSNIPSEEDDPFPSNAQDVAPAQQATPNSNVSPPQTAAKPTSRRTPNKRKGPSKTDWVRMKPIIDKEYNNPNKIVTQQDIVRIMEEKHSFVATEQMYKKRFKKWGWRRNQSHGTTTVHVRTSSSATATSSSSSESVYTTHTLYHASSTDVHMLFELFKSSAIEPTLLTHDTLQSSLIINDVFSNVSKLLDPGCGRRRHWKTHDAFAVLEDEYDDLFIGVVDFVKTSPEFDSQDWHRGLEVMENRAAPVVGECGLFALPTICACLLRMLANNNVLAAGHFLLMLLSHEPSLDNGDDSLRRIVANLACLGARSVHLLRDALVSTYVRYLAVAEDSTLSESRLSMLSLRSFYMNYIDKEQSHQRQLKRSLQDFSDLVKRSDATNGPASDKTLKIMGQHLFLLQSHDTLARQCCAVAGDMHDRMTARRQQEEVGAEQLSDELLEMWKDLKHVQATCHYKQRDLPRAISALEEYKAQCRGSNEDEFDDIAAETLQKWKVELVDAARCSSSARRNRDDGGAATRTRRGMSDGDLGWVKDVDFGAAAVVGW